ncbi:MAG: hypothetical protein ATN35_11010 [Epulopiscium sp. Nele67-Bin004]|nr:MAG: hypothetical protein ATN35_11010 [Epulopiscium sp. Nele67-Bin004]
MTIGSINSSSSIYSIGAAKQKNEDNNVNSHVEQARKRQEELTEKASTGKDINSAADNAATVAIAQEIMKAYNSYEVENNNLSDAMNMLDVADGALSSVSDNISRMHELSLQASNGTLTDSDRELIQVEIDQLKEQISSVSKDTQFNGKEVFDGNNDLVSEFNSESLNLDDYDVTTEGYTANTLTDALEATNTLRAEIGADSKGMQSQYNNNAITAENLLDTYSTMNDTDYAEVMMEQATQIALAKYQVTLQSDMMLLGSSVNVGL